MEGTGRRDFPLRTVEEFINRERFGTDLENRVRVGCYQTF